MIPTTREEFRLRMEKSGVLPNLRGGIERYFFDRVQPGHFLTAVLKGDLYETFARADDSSVENLQAIIRFLYNHTAGTAYGTPVKVQKWLKGELESPYQSEES